MDEISKVAVTDIDKELENAFSTMGKNIPPFLKNHWKLYFYLNELTRVRDSASPDATRISDLEKVIPVVIKEATESLQKEVFKGGKGKKKKVRGGEAGLSMAMISNTSGLLNATDPIITATQHVPSMLNTGSPVTSGLSTDFVDSTKGVSSTIMRSITPNLGGPVAAAQSGGRRAKPKKRN